MAVIHGGPEGRVVPWRRWRRGAPQDRLRMPYWRTGEARRPRKKVVVSMGEGDVRPRWIGSLLRGEGCGGIADM